LREARKISAPRESLRWNERRVRLLRRTERPEPDVTTRGVDGLQSAKRWARKCDLTAAEFLRPSTCKQFAVRAGDERAAILTVALMQRLVRQLAVSRDHHVDVAVHFRFQVDRVRARFHLAVNGATLDLDTKDIGRHVCTLLLDIGREFCIDRLLK